MGIILEFLNFILDLKPHLQSLKSYLSTIFFTDLFSKENQNSYQAGKTGLVHLYRTCLKPFMFNSLYKK